MEPENLTQGLHIGEARGLIAEPGRADSGAQKEGFGSPMSLKLSWPLIFQHRKYPWFKVGLGTQRRVLVGG
ncbi:MAG: hypothetical protein QXJ23_10395, partial [Thermofilum sp.]|uniref:hypothetical protein n=1 Tax=Thermofilum sp. TaxID=1961369 RepID=UPI003172CB3C